MGDRREYIKRAVEQIGQEEDTRIVRVSSLMETEPYGNVDQDRFINGWDRDILLYDDLILNEPHLTIPHIEIPKRQFVLEPLSEIAPHVRHPVLNRTILELKDALEEKDS